MKRTIKKNSQIKLIALDMDGTTLREDHETITLRTEKAIKDAIAMGIHVVPSTGRILSQLPKAITEISGIHYAVTSNGATVTNLDTSEIISNTTIGAGNLKKIMHIVKRRNFFAEVYYKGKSYSEHGYFDTYEPNEKFPQALIEVIKNNSDHVDNILEFTLERLSDIEKVNVFMLSDNDYRVLWQKFSQIKGVTLTQPLNNTIEISHHSVNKGEGLKQICKILDYNPKNVMAIGDSDNDRRMIEYAGVGVAMGNSTNELKRLANKTTLSYTEDGVAHAIEKYAINQ
jgi:Cof subfamily protein (haloacid dehalogenase superfamily)